MSYLVFLSLLAVCFSSEDPDVEVLTTDNFDAFISQNDYVLVEFYAPWCGHCKKLAPEYSKAATDLKAAGSSVKLGKVDATVEPSLGEKFAVRGYPTLKFFRNGNAIEYDGGRTTPDIIQWVTKKSGPPSRVLSTQGEVDTYLAGSGTRALAFVSASDEAVWIATANSEKVQAFSFAHVTDSSLFGSRSSQTVELHKEGEETQTYSGAFEATEIAQWFATEGFPLVDELSQDSWTRFQKSGLDLLALFQKKRDNAEAIDVAKAFKGKVVVTNSDQANIATQWGATGNVIPTAIFVALKDGQPTFVVWDEDANVELNTESLIKFVEGARDGTYASYVKSEPIPENNDGPVTTLVGKNFDSIVKAEGKDVLVEFYAPWCGHCKKLAPVWDELGKVYQEDSNIVVAKMDATANGSPKGVSIQGFPTLIFWDGNNKQHAYQGERDLPALKAFIDSHRTSTPGAAAEKVDL